MNINIAQSYYDRNGFIFIVNEKILDEETILIVIKKFTDFNKAVNYYKNNSNALFTNLTTAKERGWKGND